MDQETEETRPLSNLSSNP